MINARNLKDLQVDCEKAGFVFQNLLAWDKKNKTPNKYYMQQMEFILLLSKRPARNINDMGSSTLISVPNVRNKLHPTQKPILLLEHLIKNSSNEEDVVLDPFMGAGSTAVAAKNLKRKYIGTEIDENYFLISQERLKEKRTESLM
jgi:site-specific DNA-methyltransferase (adenine-specific)